MNVVVVDVCLKAVRMQQQLYHHLQTKSGNKDGIHFCAQSQLRLWSGSDMSINSCD